MKNKNVTKMMLILKERAKNELMQFCFKEGIMCSYEVVGGVVFGCEVQYVCNVYVTEEYEKEISNKFNK